MKKTKFTAQYLRFNKQLTALQNGKLDVVKRLAREARRELEFKNNLYQLKLHMLPYDNNRSRN